MRYRIARLAASSPGPLWIEGFTVFSTECVTEPLGTVTEPVFALIAQGAKRSALGDRIFDYHAGQYLVVTVDLPLTSQITHATPTEPFLAFGLPLEPALIAQLLMEAGPVGARPHDGPAIATSDADDKLLDAVVRLLCLLDDPRDIPVLARDVRREIHWRLLNGPQAALVRQIGLADSRLTLVAHAIEWIKTHYDQVIRIDDLASGVGVSVSSLNRHFRAATAMSPLQYQKQLRLQKARIQLIAAPGDVAAIGHTVGYDSPSQFSREYRRMFGAPPGQDAARLQTVASIQE
ncbi:putative AraC family transcriptional regulator [Rhodococcus wratislaviensis NBRC 100605]|uniref:Putative AraC family transcriptional regulator n=1 Tax=Rhodococcus wratislaviensis NBRC 100605 TaxID=1219028 RepID=X0QCJ2_RHOWR|nr:putative AraC family transcriptional regulator [Rhodococcus wratislaviensis NBRC 100605]